MKIILGLTSRQLTLLLQALALGCEGSYHDWIPDYWDEDDIADFESAVAVLRAAAEVR